MNQKVLPTPGLALDPDPSPHELDQLGRDRQTESRAAEPAGCRTVGLLERLKDRFQLFNGDADPRVGDGEAEDGAFAPRVPRDQRTRGFPRRSVNLIALPTRLTRTCRSRPASPIKASGTSGVALQASSSPLEWARSARAWSVSSSASRREKGMGSRLSLPASILEKSRMSLMTLRRESAELLTRLRYSRCRGVSSVSRASSVMPMMPFIGVRISWLMLARNSLLARLAASAASLAIRSSSCASLISVMSVRRLTTPPSLVGKSPIRIQRSGELLFVDALPAAMSGETLVHPLVLAQARLTKAAVAAELAEDFLVSDPGDQELGALGVDLAIALVADNEPLPGVIHHQPRIETFDRVHELCSRFGHFLFVLLSLGQVVQDNQEDRIVRRPRPV